MMNSSCDTLTGSGVLDSKRLILNLIKILAMRNQAVLNGGDFFISKVGVLQIHIFPCFFYLELLMPNRWSRWCDSNKLISTENPNVCITSQDVQSLEKC